MGTGISHNNINKIQVYLDADQNYKLELCYFNTDRWLTKNGSIFYYNENGNITLNESQQYFIYLTPQNVVNLACYFHDTHQYRFLHMNPVTPLNIAQKLIKYLPNMIFCHREQRDVLIIYKARGVYISGQKELILNNPEQAFRKIKN